MDWYYKNGDTRIGPVTDGQMKELAVQGKITGETLVWNEVTSKWRPYNDVIGGAPLSAPLKPETEAPKEEIKDDSFWDPYANLDPTGHSSATIDPESTAHPNDSPEAPASAPSKTESYCSKCYRKFPDEDLIQYGDLKICADCKPIFFQRLKEGSEVAGTLNYAGFWIRFVAKFIDAIIGWAFGMLIHVVAGFSIMGNDHLSMMTPSRGALYVFINLLQWSFSIAYATFFVGKYGATPGKMALGLKVVTPDGGKVSYMKAFGRFFAEIISGLLLGIGYLMIAFDSEKRALHDRICGTRVIRK